MSQNSLDGGFWNCFYDVTCFHKTQKPAFLNEVKASMPTLERFTVLLYSRFLNTPRTNTCRRKHFCKGRAIGNIPLTRAALWKHVVRAAYYAGHIWGQSLMAFQELLPPEE